MPDENVYLMYWAENDFCFKYLTCLFTSIVDDSVCLLKQCISCELQIDFYLDTKLDDQLIFLNAFITTVNTKQKIQIYTKKNHLMGMMKWKKNSSVNYFILWKDLFS